MEINESLKDFSPEKMNYLKLLATKFPTQQSVCTEIINLNAIQNLPKGTEHFMSDLHGEYEAFQHILNNCSGVIREKVILALGGKLYENEINDLCTLIYYPKERLALLEKGDGLSYEWYKDTLSNLVLVARKVSSKYTRSKVRKKLSPDFAYIIDELLHMMPDIDGNQLQYHEKILDTIIKLNNADAFIIALSKLIKDLAVDHWHLLGDVYDRGSGPDYIMDMLMTMKEVDITWGNHDALWIGAASGSWPCIANVIRNNIRYKNIRVIESGYGISLRGLATFAEMHYTGTPEEASIKAINVLTLKLEGMAIKRHPEWEMDDRLLFERVDFENGTVEIEGKPVKLNTDEFRTVNPENPYTLTDEEKKVMEDLAYSFVHSTKLKQHMDWMLSKGSMYLIYNGNLMFHGCVPLDRDGGFAAVRFGTRKYSGRALMNYCEKVLRRAWTSDELTDDDHDAMWYMWAGTQSPLCGRVIKTWERTYIDDKEYWKEPEDPYYIYYNDDETCRKILSEFGVDPNHGHIFNGHTPVKASSGENPVKAGGKLIVIDGGFCRAYHKKTGIAGYTLIYNSHGMRLKSHQPFKDIESAIRENADIQSTTSTVEIEKKRMHVSDSDIGKDLSEQIDSLLQLLQAYRYGMIREK